MVRGKWVTEENGQWVGGEMVREKGSEEQKDRIKRRGSEKRVNERWSLGKDL